MKRSIRINPMTVRSYGPGEGGTILVTRRFGTTQMFVLADSVQEVAARLSAVRGLFPGLIEFELADDREEP